MPLTRISALVLAILLLSNFCQADPTSDIIRKQAEANATAIQSGDYERVVDVTYPKLVELIGGKEKMLEMFKTGMSSMQASGLKISSITVGQPGAVTTSGDKLYSVVPTNMVIISADSKLSQNSYLLAVSTDKGATWKFLDGSGVNPTTLLLVIPDFPTDLKLPDREAPKVEPVSPKTP